MVPTYVCFELNLIIVFDVTHKGQGVQKKGFEGCGLDHPALTQVLLRLPKL